MTDARSEIEELTEALSQAFPGLPRDTIVRQFVDAMSSVELFAVSGADEPGLVIRLARSHLEALAQLRNDG